MSRKQAADTTHLALDTESLSPERLKVRAMFKRLMMVAEVLSKAAEPQEQAQRPMGHVSQKTQK